MNRTLLPCVLVVAGLVGLPTTTSAGEIRLGELLPDSASQDWGELHTDASVQGKPLSIGGRHFAHGLGTHANSEITYELDGKCTSFSAWVGVDYEMKGYTESSVVFQVFGDGKKLFDSGVMRLNDAAKQLTVPLAGVDELKLVVTDAGNGIGCDHADWCEPVLSGEKPAEAVAVAKYQVTTPGLTLSFDERGRIVGSSLAALAGQTQLGGCRQTGKAVATQLPGGGLVFTRKLTDAEHHHATLSDRFTPTKDSVRWEIEIVSGDAPWSTSIETRLRYPVSATTRFWTAWSDPEHRSDGWRDPLVLQPFSNTAWPYSNLTYPVPEHGDFISVPLVSIVEPAKDTGLSLVLSPENTTLEMWLRTTAAGAIQFARTKHRLGDNKPVRFAMDLTAHEADWRGGLRWMTARYAKFFDPPNPLVDEMAGCGAYSGDENPLDAAKFKRMGFRINWKLSDDFAYMGMFIPPVKDADEKWDRSCDEKAPANKPRWTSCRRLNDYARYMKSNGFYVLNYFNVTEFGKNMGGPPIRKAGDPELWKDPRAFLAYALPGATLIGGNATCYAASVTDCGDPGYRKFLLEQAERHNRLIPDSFGICIDRLDWLARFNPRGDDGQSWVGGRPARALYSSWQSLMEELGPLMHKAGKVIFINPINAKLDWLRHVDGIYTEQGQSGPALNASALMCLRKPVMAWSYNETLGQPNPDAFMQRHLHLGVYPTAPYPWNNHCINPSPAADKLYLDYGPLLDALRGKKWLLTPHCVRCDTPEVKVNMFQVPGGYVVPVTFGTGSTAQIVVARNVPGIEHARCEAMHPGASAVVPLSGHYQDGMLRLAVPLVRGCAVVRLSFPLPCGSGQGEGAASGT